MIDVERLARVIPLMEAALASFRDRGFGLGANADVMAGPPPLLGNDPQSPPPLPPGEEPPLRGMGRASNFLSDLSDRYRQAGGRGQLLPFMSEMSKHFVDLSGQGKEVKAWRAWDDYRKQHDEIMERRAAFPTLPGLPEFPRLTGADSTESRATFSRVDSAESPVRPMPQPPGPLGQIISQLMPGGTTPAGVPAGSLSSGVGFGASTLPPGGAGFGASMMPPSVADAASQMFVSPGSTDSPPPWMGQEAVGGHEGAKTALDPFDASDALVSPEPAHRGGSSETERLLRDVLRVLEQIRDKLPTEQATGEEEDESETVANRRPLWRKAADTQTPMPGGGGGGRSISVSLPAVMRPPLPVPEVAVP